MSETNDDLEHLRLLSIFHYIVGGLAGLLLALFAFPPFGTVLGVFTIIVLQRPSVKQLFAATAPSQHPSAT